MIGLLRAAKKSLMPCSLNLRALIATKLETADTTLNVIRLKYARAAILLDPERRDAVFAAR